MMEYEKDIVVKRKGSMLDLAETIFKSVIMLRSQHPETMKTGFLSISYCDTDTYAVFCGLIFEPAGFEVKRNSYLMGYEIDLLVKFGDRTLVIECKQYEKSYLPVKNLILQWKGKNEILKADRIILINPSHLSLHFKKVGKLWSVRAGMNHRVLAFEENNDFILVWIGTHDEYERMIREKG